MFKQNIIFIIALKKFNHHGKLNKNFLSLICRLDLFNRVLMICVSFCRLVNRRHRTHSEQS